MEAVWNHCSLYNKVSCINFHPLAYQHILVCVLYVVNGVKCWFQVWMISLASSIIASERWWMPVVNIRSLCQPQTKYRADATFERVTLRPWHDHSQSWFCMGKSVVKDVTTKIYVPDPLARLHLTQGTTNTNWTMELKIHKTVLK